MAVATYQIGADFDDPEHAMPAAYGFGSNGAVLIRPDGFVGWRSAETARLDMTASIETLAGALRAMTGR